MAQKVSKEIRAQEFVEYALRIGALELIPEGRKLKNGRISPCFFNAGLFNSGEAISMIANAYSDVISEKFCGLNDEPTFDVLYGPPYKGTILVPAIAAVQNIDGLGNIRWCTNRKEAKDHGEGGTLIGSQIIPEDRVVIIDDVITDGGTKREAVEFIKCFGGMPSGLVIAFDRQEHSLGGLSAVQKFEQDYQIPVYSVATLADLISTLKNRSENDAQLDSQSQFRLELMIEKICAYQQKYGVS